MTGSLDSTLRVSGDLSIIGHVCPRLCVNDRVSPLATAYPLPLILICLQLWSLSNEENMMLQDGPCVKVITDHQGPVKVGSC